MGGAVVLSCTAPALHCACLKPLGHFHFQPIDFRNRRYVARSPQRYTITQCDHTQGRRVPQRVLFSAWPTAATTPAPTAMVQHVFDRLFICLPVQYNTAWNTFVVIIISQQAVLCVRVGLQKQCSCENSTLHGQNRVLHAACTPRLITAVNFPTRQQRTLHFSSMSL